MALKFLIDSLDGLDESVKGLYKAKGDKFELSIDGLPEPEDVSGLKAKVDQLLTEKKTASKKAAEAEEAARLAAEEAARKSGDVEALERSWKEKFEARENELTSQIEAMAGSVNKLMVDNVASSMAAELAVQGSADILIPHIRQRLSAEERDGSFVTMVKGPDGKPSALTLDDLKTEFAKNAAFAPVIVASQATGSGAHGGNSGGAANKTVTRSQFEAMDASGRSEFSKSGGVVTD
jgi:hypothetical protein